MGHTPPLMWQPKHLAHPRFSLALASKMVPRWRSIRGGPITITGEIGGEVAPGLSTISSPLTPCCSRYQPLRYRSQVRLPHNRDQGGERKPDLWWNVWASLKNIGFAMQELDGLPTLVLLRTLADSYGPPAGPIPVNSVAVTQEVASAPIMNVHAQPFPAPTPGNPFH
ncbi:UNVERIFIED_CONTAM: hypothetical protein K2H54_047226 [Gekko kuhli]